MQPGRLTADERAIEGLPIRLVIALMVGVSSLSVKPPAGSQYADKRENTKILVLRQ